jgi:hypothetical protein
MDHKVLTPTWRLALHAARNAPKTHKMRLTKGKPWRKLFSRTGASWKDKHIVEILGLAESVVGPKTIFHTAFRLKGGRFGYVLAVWDRSNDTWEAREHLAWNLESLMNEAMTAQAISHLRLHQRLIEA